MNDALRSPDVVPGLNAFVDLSHHNLDVDLTQARDAGLVGVLHKATQGDAFVDPTYADRVREARSLGLLVGAYHFCTDDDVPAQIQRFLDTVAQSGAAGVLPCLDWEPNPTPGQGTMSKAQLVSFIDAFQQRTGRFPVLYGGYWMLGALSDGSPSGSIGRCPLWQSFYSASFGWLSDLWDRWTLLQYTDGTLGPAPHGFPGLGVVDRDTFNGTLEEAREFWRTHALPG